MRIKWIKLLIPCFLLSVGECGSHSLLFLSTGRTKPKDRPLFEQLTTYDDVPISYCDSWNRSEQIKPTLENNHLFETCDGPCDDMIVALHEIPTLINSTVYVVQRRRGCIQSADRSVSGFEAWAVNGLDFLTFDSKSQKWTAHSPSAKTLQQIWNKDEGRNIAFSDFIKNICPLMIQKITFKMSSEYTELHVFAKPTNDKFLVLLRCHLATTDKSVTSVDLIVDGASGVDWTSLIGPLPSGDTSVILRLTARISLKQKTSTYGCSVKTGSHKTTVFWDGKTLDGTHLFFNGNWMALTAIMGFGIMAILVVIIIYGLILLQKHAKRSQSPPKKDPQLMRFIKDSSFLELKITVLVDEDHQDYLVQWEKKNKEEDQDYFAHQ
ncbi:uncharacterized protein LOC115434425 [Sphaeramia orbicularis]|uniref:uncharacterized protein LOC115434425 n=1 Tax=Sphaeramia orbicularis TaxID=375764 RepID=UPI00117CE9F5|nr:uncharacterized protein LOC115434425 [Sphaeramia orbicularis]